MGNPEYALLAKKKETASFSDLVAACGVVPNWGSRGGWTSRKRRPRDQPNLQAQITYIVIFTRAARLVPPSGPLLRSLALEEQRMYSPTVPDQAGYARQGTDDNQAPLSGT